MTANNSPAVVTFSFLSADEAAAMGNPIAFLESLTTDEAAHEAANVALKSRWSMLARLPSDEFVSIVAALLMLELVARKRAYKRLHEACELSNAPHTVQSRKNCSELAAIERAQVRVLTSEESEANEAKKRANAEANAQAAENAKTIAADAIRAPLLAIIAARDATIAELESAVVELRTALAIASAELTKRDAPRGHAKRAASVAAVA